MRVLPDVAVQPRETGPGSERYVRSYVTVRFAIGVLGLALPFVLVLVEPILFDGQPFPRGSLSAYYYSGMRELFVGVLWAIGVFLVLYKLDRVLVGKQAEHPRRFRRRARRAVPHRPAGRRRELDAAPESPR